MDFHGMKRKKLQSLCKKHGIPANLKNAEMAERLSLIFNEGKENQVCCSDNARLEKRTPRNVSGKNTSSIDIIDLVSPSPDSAKPVKSSEIEFENCGVEENTISEKEQVDVEASEEFVNPMGENTDVHAQTEAKSSDTHHDLTLASGTPAENADSCEMKFLSSQKMSLSPEERADSSPELVENSEIKRSEIETNLSPERSDDGIGDFYVKENLQPASSALVMEDESIKNVASEDYGNCLVEGEKVGKMPNITCGSDKGGAETEKQRDTNSPQGSIMNKKVNLSGVSPEINENFPPENLRVKENIQRDVNKEVLHPALGTFVMDNESIMKVASEEFESLVEGEVNKSSSQTCIDEDTNRTEKGEAEAEKQDDTNSPQCSNINNADLLHVSAEEPVDCVAEGEGHELESNMCVHGSVSNVPDGGFVAVNMCVDASTGANYSDEKANATVEHILDEVHSSSFKDSDGTPVQHPPTYTPSEVKSGKLSIHRTAVSGTATKNADACEAKFVSSGKKSTIQASERIIGFSPKLISNSDIKVLQSGADVSAEAPRFDIRTCDAEEEIQIDVIKEKAKNCLEVLDAAPSVMFMNDENIQKVASPDFGNHLVEEVQKSEYNIFHDGAYNLRVNGTEVSALGLFETSIPAEDTDGKSNVTMEFFSDDVPSSGVEHSDGTPDQFLRSHPQVEVKSSSLNIHQMATSDTSEEKLKSLQNTSQFSDTTECVGFSPNNLEASEIEGLQAETDFEPSTLGDVAATSNVKESMQSDNMEKEYNQGADSTNNAVVSNNVDLLQSSLEECYRISGLFDDCDVRKSYTSNPRQNFASDTSEENMRSSKETCQIANPNECIVFSPDNKHEASEIKGFQVQVEADSDPSILGDLVGTCNMKESMESNKMDTEYIQEVFHSTKDDVLNSANLIESSVEECYSVLGEVTGFSDHYIVHDDSGGTREEEENETYMVSAKRLKTEMESKPDGSNLHQNFASDAAGDECVHQEKMESPPKCTPIPSSEEGISVLPDFLGSSMKKELKNETNLPLKRARNVLGTCDMKENIKSAKKEQVGSITSKNTVPKRQPLQDLQQNRTLEPL